MARALSTFANKYPNDLRDCEELTNIAKEIVATLQAKFWHGKEDLLETAAALCSKPKSVADNLDQNANYKKTFDFFYSTD